MKILQNMERIKKINKNYLNRTKYLDYYEKLSIAENYILLECQHGITINGNVFYLLKELCCNSKYKEYQIFLSVAKECEDKIRELLLEYHLENVILVKMHSKEYYKLIATAKYLINDTTFLPFFIKKEGQVYLNTWHGTPLKTLGKKVKNDFLGIGNVQKNFVVADYLLYPNEYTMEHMSEDYMINELTSARAVISGYPRNSVFLNKKRAEEIKIECAIEDKEVFAYMPTWRGLVGKEEREQQIEKITGYLEKIDVELKDNQVLYVNLHPFVGCDIDLNNFQKIENFPKQYETYDFLSACDCLITDYSSVFYDYAITRKKIILFTYDKEEYFKERGVYVSLDELPFPQTDNVQQLLKEMNREKEYDDTDFIKTYCACECINASEKLLDLILFQKKDNIEVIKFPRNGKNNVLMYTGNMAKNGLTSSIMNLLSHIDLKERNYYITFPTHKVEPYKEILQRLPEGVNYIPTKGRMNASINEKTMLLRYRTNTINAQKTLPKLERLYDYEVKRCYGDAEFSNVIHFTGYEFRKQLLYSRFLEANKVIYVHNNVIEEIKVRRNLHPVTLKYAYNHYDAVAMVTEDMEAPTSKYCSDKEKMKIATNIFDWKGVKEKAEQSIQFDEETECNIDKAELEKILESDAVKFINIGRFSPEKGHRRLLNSFNKLWKENKETYLIIIGGHGVEYEKTLNYAAKLDAADHIIIIKYMTNPFPVLKKCDCFAFSSFHEGFGLVLLEADVLGVPVFSTDILGPSGFLKVHNGTLVENTEEGIYKGMEMYLQGEIQTMNIDYKEYNRKAVKEFEDLLK